MAQQNELLVSHEYRRNALLPEEWDRCANAACPISTLPTGTPFYDPCKPPIWRLSGDCVRPLGSDCLRDHVYRKSICVPTRGTRNPPSRGNRNCRGPPGDETKLVHACLMWWHLLHESASIIRDLRPGLRDNERWFLQNV